MDDTDGPNPRSITSTTVSTDGESIYVEVTAPIHVPQPPTIVLGHGAGGCRLCFFQQTEVLSRTHRVVVWDQRGFGASTATTGRTGPLAAADDLLAVLDAIGIDNPVHFVGQSMGGWAIVRAALLQPDRVASLVLSGSNGGLFTDATRSSLDTFIDHVAAGADHPLVAGQTAALAPSFTTRSPALTNLYQQIGLLPNPGLDAVRRIRATEFNLTDVVDLALPMLFMVGENDAIFAPDDIDQLVNYIPTAEVAHIPHAGHSPYFEEADLFNELLLRFVSTVQKPDQLQHQQD